MKQFTLVERAERLEIQHAQRHADAGYDWSCIQVTRTEAKWLARKLIAWADKGPRAPLVKRERSPEGGA